MQKYLIVGMGASGQSVLRWCLHQGITPVVADTRSDITLPAQVQALPAHQRYLGEQALQQPSLWSGVQAVVLSPGLSPLSPVIARLLAQAQAKGLPVYSDIDLFFQGIAQIAHYQPQVLGITGTNGKTTVTTLTAHLLQQVGVSAQVAGNVSPPVLDALLQAMQTGNLPAVWVLELSSFQLHYSQQGRFVAGAILNITQDHLDWHGSMQAYAQAKAKLWQVSDICIANADDPTSMALLPAERQQRLVSLKAPQHIGDMGLCTHRGLPWLTRRQWHQAVASDDLMMPADAMRLRGLHNAFNAMVALQLCRAVGVEPNSVLAHLRSYQAQSHRFESVRQIKGVDFIDDSKATNVGATQAALWGLDRPAWLILGGVTKGQDFSPLCEPLQQHAKGVFLIGHDVQALQSMLATTTLPVWRVQSLEAAVQQAFEQAEPHDIVLLSPACASLDMFDNYQHRGRLFADAVHQLALEQGEV